MNNAGYVYILTNSAMPGLVKIGRTSRDVDLRASELWQTGVPQKFEVFWTFKTPDCVQLEAYAHADLSKYRVSKLREFFRIDPIKAQDRIKVWAGFQATDWVEDVFTGFTAVHYSEASATMGIQDLAAETGQTPFLVSCALEMVTASELAPAIERALEKKRQQDIESLKRMGIPKSEWGGLLDDGA